MRVARLTSVVLLALVCSPWGIAQQAPPPLDPLPEADTVLDILLTGGDDGDEWLPARVLTQRPDVSERYVPAFQAALQDEDMRVRYRALTRLGIGSYAQRELAYREGGIAEVARALRPLRALEPDLLSLLEDPETSVREEATGVVANVLPPSPKVLGALTARLEDPDWNVRVAVLEAFLHFGPCIREQVAGSVLQAARSPMAAEKEAIAGAAVFALGWLHTDAEELKAGVEETLRRGLTDERTYVRQEALNGVSEAGIAARPLRGDVARIAEGSSDASHLPPKARAALVSIDGARRAWNYRFQNRCDDPDLR